VLYCLLKEYLLPEERFFMDCALKGRISILYLLFSSPENLKRVDVLRALHLYGETWIPQLLFNGPKSIRFSNTSIIPVKSLSITIETEWYNEAQSFTRANSIATVTRTSSSTDWHITEKLCTFDPSNNQPLISLQHALLFDHVTCLTNRTKITLSITLTQSNISDISTPNGRFIVPYKPLWSDINHTLPVKFYHTIILDRSNFGDLRPSRSECLQSLSRLGLKEYRYNPQTDFNSLHYF
jgi:hypothetical protein